MKQLTHKGFARFLARWIVGLTFLMAGWWKCFELTPLGHAEKFFIDGYSETWLPQWLLWGTGVIIPPLELIAGGLLIIGLFHKHAMYVLGIILIIVTYGHLLTEPLFSLIYHILPRFIILLIVLVLPEEEDILMLDKLLFKNST